ncbi:hypothetical protein MMC31_003328, partial [Peltigera leucophlebia]|nr:hypothetical protein [Peltigera leucophlebia]
MPQSRALPPPPFKEYSSSATCYRGFCSNCGGSLTWRTDDRPDEVEIFTGSVDEECLIGARTKSVASSMIAQRGGWEGCLSAERAEELNGGSGKVGNGGGANGRELAVPKKHFFYRNAVKGATDRIHLLTAEVGE